MLNHLPTVPSQSHCLVRAVGNNCLQVLFPFCQVPVVEDPVQEAGVNQLPVEGLGGGW